MNGCLFCVSATTAFVWVVRTGNCEKCAVRFCAFFTTRLSFERKGFGERKTTKCTSTLLLLRCGKKWEQPRRESGRREKDLSKRHVSPTNQHSLFFLAAFRNNDDNGGNAKQLLPDVFVILRAEGPDLYEDQKALSFWCTHVMLLSRVQWTDGQCYVLHFLSSFLHKVVKQRRLQEFWYPYRAAVVVSSGKSSMTTERLLMHYKYNKKTKRVCMMSVVLVTATNTQIRGRRQIAMAVGCSLFITCPHSLLL